MAVYAILFTSLLVLIGTKASLAQDAQSCKSYIQCSQDADTARSECEKLIVIPYPVNSNSSAKNGSAKSVKSAPLAGDCASNVKNISEQLIQKQTEQRQQERACLNSHLSDAQAVDKSRQAICQKSVDSASVKTSHRMKRASANATASPNAANATSRANSSAPASNATVQADKDSKKNGSASAGNDYAAYAKCIQEAELKSRACRPLAACCSETTTCDFEYKLSPLYHDITQLHYGLYKAYRQCQKDRLKAANAGKN